MAEITVEQWLAELARLSTRPSAEGYTVQELRALTGHSEPWLCRRIRQALDAGMCERGERAIERIDGRPARVPVYRFVNVELT